MDYNNNGIFPLLIIVSIILCTVSSYPAELVPCGIGICDYNIVNSIHYVGGDGPGNYSSIQQAIDHTSPGDTVCVYPGVYYENLVVETSITLQGLEMDTTVINGGNSGDIPAIRVDADKVNITGFTIVWADWEYHEPGIKIYSNHVHVYNNNISFHDKGIILTLSAKECLIEKNIFYNNFEGILLFQPGSHNHTIQDNTFQKCSFGIILTSSHNNIIHNNTITNSPAKAIALQDSKNNIIKNNTITKSSRGVYLEGDSTGNLIYNNNFIENLNHAINSKSNNWDNGVLDGGNYWDDYVGLDEDNDGFGDQSYVISGGSAEDKYPLMRPYQWQEKDIYLTMYGPTRGFILEPYQFNVTVLGGLAPYIYTWDFDDGSNSSIKEPLHTYETPGDYCITVSVKDAKGHIKEQNYMLTIYDIDIIPPVVSIVSPRYGIYVQNKLVPSSVFFPFCLVFGPITIIAQSSDIGSEISKMTLTIDDVLSQTYNDADIYYHWINESNGKYTIIVTAEDIAGNTATDELQIIRL